ncbi:helix-turn-helix domain-containing protein [Pontibacter sp. H259]|uniref:helix-turn-helix domain-containing protein n=1 Tax=Pontibacter sp. H259 TaxID=3133421 RepID=UPI0030BA7176
MKTLLEKLTNIEELLKQQYLAEKKVLSLKEAAIYMDASESLLYSLTSNRLIPHSKPVNRIYFDRDELDKWMLSKKVKTIKEIEEEADIFIVKRRNK